MRVEVRNNNIDGALRVLKKKLQQQQLDVPLTIIGEITQQSGLLFEYMGDIYPLHVHGYQHFA